jgi:hypothetical protein
LVTETKEETQAEGVLKDDVEENGGECRTLHNEELNDLYSSSNIVRVIKSR